MHPARPGHAARLQQQASILATWWIENDSATFVQAQRPPSIAAILGNFAVLKLHPDFLSILGVTTTAVDLVFSVQGQELRLKRGNLAPAVIEAIPYAMSRIEYIRESEKGDTIFRDAVGKCQDGHWLLLGMKFKPAKDAPSGKDEAWGRTAYFFNEPRLRRMVRGEEWRAIHPGVLDSTS